MEEETEEADGGRTESRRRQTTCTEGKKHGRQVTCGVLGGEGMRSDHASHKKKLRQFHSLFFKGVCAPRSKTRKNRYFGCERADEGEKSRRNYIRGMTVRVAYKEQRDLGVGGWVYVHTLRESRPLGAHERNIQKKKESA